jgi:hypothetical protein
MTAETHASSETDQIVDLLISDLSEDVLLMLATKLSRGSLNPTVATARIRHLKLGIEISKEPDQGRRERTMTFVEYRAIVGDTL